MAEPFRSARQRARKPARRHPDETTPSFRYVGANRERLLRRKNLAENFVLLFTAPRPGFMLQVADKHAAALLKAALAFGVVGAALLGRHRRPAGAQANR